MHSLGRFSASFDGEAVPRWRAGGSRVLFQYLVAHRGRPVPRETLAEVAWPDRCDDGVRNSLKVALHAVRRVLADAEGLTLEHRDSTYVLRDEAPCSIWVDYEELPRLQEAAERAHRSGDRRASWWHVDRAADLYAGDFLPDETAEWVVRHRAWARSVVLRTLHDARVAALTAGDHRAAMHWCRRLLDVDDLDEPSYQTSLWLHARLGERSEVAETYLRCRERMLTVLDVVPSDLTEHLFQEGVRRRDIALPAALTATL